MSDRNDGATVGQKVGEVGAVVEKAVEKAVDDIGSYIRSQREGAQVSLRQLARAAGVSNPYLSQIERGLRKPSAEILQQIAKGLRISAEALYVKAGILEEKPASAVTDAVLADPSLSERQKQVLLDVYQSFRGENTAAERAEAARTPLLAVLGAGDAAVTVVTKAIVDAQTRRRAQADKVQAYVTALPQKLNADEARKTVAELREQAGTAYAGFAERGE